MFAKADNDTIAIDVETSGPDPFEHQLLAVALAPVAGLQQDAIWHVRADPIKWTPVGRSYFERFAREWESRALPPHVVVQQLNEYLAMLPSKEPMLVGHNVGFDYAFLKKLLHDTGQSINISHRTLDTHTMLRVLSWFGRIPASACTSDGAFEYFDIRLANESRHTALADAQATRALFRKVLSEFEEFSKGILVEIPRSASRR